MKALRKRSLCGISSLLDVLGDKWSLLIIRDIMFKGKSTYGEFLASDEKIATNILADRLELLESQGFIVSKPHPDSRVKSMYSLTQKGLDLMPVLMEMLVWADSHMEISQQGRDFAKLIRSDRKGAVKRALERLRSGQKKGER